MNELKILYQFLIVMTKYLKQPVSGAGRIYFVSDFVRVLPTQEGKAWLELKVVGASGWNPSLLSCVRKAQSGEY